MSFAATENAPFCRMRLQQNVAVFKKYKTAFLSFSRQISGNILKPVEKVNKSLNNDFSFFAIFFAG